MKIGIDLRLLAGGRHTGVEEYTLGLLRHVFERDHKNEYVLFFNAWGNAEPDFSWMEKYKNVTLRRFRIPNKLLNLALWYLSFPKLDRLIGGVDVFFMPNLNFAAFSKRVKVMVTAHDLSFEYFPETFSWKQRVWHYLINFRSLLRRADQIIAVSHSTENDLVRLYGVSRDKISVIHSGIDERFKPMSRNDPQMVEVQKKYHLPYRFVLYLGTLEPRKNVEALVSAYEVFQKNASLEEAKIHLVISGALGWKYQPLLEKIGRSASREKIHLIGFVDEGDKPALYNLAQVFVYPSFYEGFGFPPLEAIGCGVPVIASHSSSLPEVVGAAGVLIDPYRPDELLQALRELSRDGMLSDELRKEALRHRKIFSWSSSAQAFCTLLERFD